MRRAWTLRARARADMQLPLQRYFLFAGGALFILLFATDWVAPPPKGERVKSEVSLPVIRIHSERKGPEAVVFDTTQPTFVAPVEQDGAATPQAVASAESSATEAVSQLSGSMPEAAEPAKLSNPKGQHREIGAHARLTRRPLHHHPASSRVPQHDVCRSRKPYARSVRAGAYFPACIASTHTQSHQPREPG